MLHESQTLFCKMFCEPELRFCPAKICRYTVLANHWEYLGSHCYGGIISILSGIFFRDCDDAYELGGARASGVYFIQPDDDEPFQVYCDMDTDGGGWTVFQRRKDGSVDFNRDWVDYEQGFGDLTGEFWLGLNKTHRITAISPAAADNELRIDLEDFDQNSRYAKYGLFAIRDSAAIYRLTVSKYSGTAGDSLAWFHNGLLYSTKDQDNDPCYTCSCSLSYKGAWWYAVCHQSNLNGEYLGGQHSLYARGIVWNSWRGYQYSLKFTEMKVRRQ